MKGNKTGTSKLKRGLRGNKDERRQRQKQSEQTWTKALIKCREVLS